MKVIYRKTILDLIDDEIEKAFKSNTPIEKIILSAYEWSRFCKSLGVLSVAGCLMHRGIVITREEYSHEKAN